VDALVYFEETFDVFAALEREKQIRKWRREKKDALVRSMNPEWRDLGLLSAASSQQRPVPPLSP